MTSGYIAVHIGAGYHALVFRAEYKNACRRACNAAIEMLRNGCSAVDTATKAISILENCPLSNAGIGSNPDLNGIVECDAGIMDGRTLNYGSVASLTNIKNPIQVANKILELQNTGLSGNRIPASFLAGKRALKFALNEGFNYVENKDLSMEPSMRNFERDLTILQQASVPLDKAVEALSLDEAVLTPSSILMDTVGAVCVDSFGNVSSAASSAGLSMKYPGRMGQSPMYGSGFWAQHSYEFRKPSIACTATGTGEFLIKTSLAKECYDTLYEMSDDTLIMERVFKEIFFDSPYLADIDHKLAGVLSLQYYGDRNECKVNWAHNTKSMILGWGSVKSGNVYSYLSEQGEDNNHFIGHGFTFN